MNKRTIGLMILTIGLAGCVPSLHELYTTDTVVYDPALLGDWQQDTATWNIEGDPNTRSYQIIIDEDKKDSSRQSRLEGHLVELGKTKYLDLFPNKDVDLHIGDWFKAHLLRAHLFLKVEIKNGNIILSVMNPDVLGKMLEKDPDIIKHEKTQDTIVLTASPLELQAFLIKYAATDKFFGDPVELKPLIIEKK